jgi:hypothetical protein
MALSLKTDVLSATMILGSGMKTVAEARANREMLTLTRKIASTVVHIPARCSNCGACNWNTENGIRRCGSCQRITPRSRQPLVW